MHSFLYIFVDTFIGGGLVIDSHLRDGLTGNAGAIGSMPLGLAGPHAAPPRATAERRVAAHAGAGLCARRPGRRPPASTTRGAASAVARASRAPGWPRPPPRSRMAINSAACLLDLEGVIVDGAFDRELLERADRRDRGRAGALQLGRRARTAAAGRHRSARTRARSAARCCRCTPTSRPTATCSSRCDATRELAAPTPHSGLNPASLSSSAPSLTSPRCRP